VRSVAPFAPAYRDGRSAASLIVELAHGKPYGYLLTYEEIAGQLGVGPDDLVRIRSGIARTKDRLLREHQRGIEARPGKGYVILHPGQHAHLATKHRKKSDRQIKHAIRVIKGADERDMTDMERERNRQVGMVLERLHERQQDVEDRVSRLESLMLGTRKIVPGTAETLSAAIEGKVEDDGQMATSDPAGGS
jgi:alkylated DNA nucleotide flippase Atl1